MSMLPNSLWLTQASGSTHSHPSLLGWLAPILDLHASSSQPGYTVPVISSWQVAGLRKPILVSLRLSRVRMRVAGLPWRRASLGTNVPKDGDQGAWKHPQGPGNLEPGAPAFPQQSHLDSCPNISLSTGPVQCRARVLSPCTVPFKVQAQSRAGGCVEGHK